MSAILWGILIGAPLGFFCVWFLRNKDCAEWWENRPTREDPDRWERCRERRAMRYGKVVALRAELKKMSDNNG